MAAALLPSACFQLSSTLNFNYAAACLLAAISLPAWKKYRQLTKIRGCISRRVKQSYLIQPVAKKPKQNQTKPKHSYLWLVVQKSRSSSHISHRRELFRALPLLSAISARVRVYTVEGQAQHVLLLIKSKHSHKECCNLNMNFNSCKIAGSKNNY